MTYWKYFYKNLTSYCKICEISNYEASGVLNINNSFICCYIFKFYEFRNGNIPIFS